MKKEEERDLKQLKNLLKKVVSYGFKKKPKKPTKQPNKVELEKIYKFNGIEIICSSLTI